jgi:hypothetical protein
VIWGGYSSLLGFRGTRKTIQKVLHLGNILKTKVRTRVVRKPVPKGVVITWLKLERQDRGIGQGYQSILLTNPINSSKSIPRVRREVK